MKITEMRYFSYLILISLLNGCVTSSTEDPKIQEWSYFDKLPEPLQLKTEIVPGTYPLKLELYLINRADTAINVMVYGTDIGQVFNFAVINSDSNLVWTDYNGAVDLIGVVQKVEPGTTLVHTSEWDLQSNFGYDDLSGQTLHIMGKGNLTYDWDRSLGLSENGSYVSESLEITIE